MNSRQRFLARMSYQPVDRLPRLEEGIREEVQRAWEAQGMPAQLDLLDWFGFDRREEIEPDLSPHPARYPRTLAELPAYRRRFSDNLSRRLPAPWQKYRTAWRNRTVPLILRVHSGFFLSLGVEGWQEFIEVIALTKDQPRLVREMLCIQGEFIASLVQKVLAEVDVDAVLFSEPIGGNHGPLISPKMYQDLMLPALRLIYAVVKHYRVPVTILRTYAHPRPLLPLLVNHGINCLWAVEAPPDGMDYLSIRREFGKDLRLIGGIDMDILRQPSPEQRLAAIRAALERVAALAESGGYIPLLDGRVRDDVRYENYLYYRQELRKITDRPYG